MKFREETAVVEKIEDGDFIVRFLEPSEDRCARCGLCKGAGAVCAEPRLLRIPAESMAGNPRPGEQISVHIPDLGAAFSGVVVLGIPLGAGFAALILGSVFNLADWAAILLGVAGFAVGWSASYLFWGKKAKPFAVAGNFKKPSERID